MKVQKAVNNNQTASEGQPRHSKIISVLDLPQNQGCLLLLAAPVESSTDLAALTPIFINHSSSSKVQALD